MKGRDAIIIGGGPAGYVAAIRASQLGASVALVEENKLGGTCINCGCIPTKFLLHRLDLCKSISALAHPATGGPVVKPAIIASQPQKNELVASGVAGIRGLLRSNHVEVVAAKGTLDGATRVKLHYPSGEQDTIEAKRIIIASGSKPARLSVPGANDSDVLNHESLLSLETAPDTAVIIGGGVVGVEMATILNRLGTKVTVIEMMPRILSNQDSEVVAVLDKAMREDGISIYCGAKLESIASADPGKIVVFSSGGETRTLKCEKVAVCIGQKPNVEDLGLGEMGIMAEKGRIAANERMQTNVDGIYAAGDVVGGAMLAHVAFAQGKIAAENALGKNSAINYKAIPQCIFTSPEIACVGLTEEAARAQGFETRVGRFPFAANSMAAILGDTRGFVKVVTDKEYGQILGFQMVGYGASNLVAEAALAVKLELTLDEMGSMVHSHPSLSEALWEATLDVTRDTIHFPSSRPRGQ